MNILVTGGCGFIGSNLVKTLLGREHVDHVNQILVLDDHSSGQVMLDPLEHPKVHYILASTLDIFQLPTVMAFQPTLVYHLGEYSRIYQSFNDPTAVFESNLMGTINVLKYCLQKQSKLVYSGSSAIFAKELAPYTWAKAKIIELIKLYHDWYNLDYVIVYFYNVYGPGQIEDGAYQTVMGVFERQYRLGQNLTVVLPGSQVRCYTHIDDIVTGLILCGQSGQGDGYHLSSEVVTSLVELAKLFTEDDSRIEYLEARPGDRKEVTLMESKARTELGWSCRRDLKEYIAEVKSKI